MAKLILIKHSQPVVDPDVPSPRWVLSDSGRERCAWLAGELKTQRVARVYSSLEPKALETAALVATRIGLPVEARDGLQENDRSALGFPPEDELRRKIEAFFQRPGDVVMGTETADAARARFAAAVGRVLGEAGGRNLAVVTHGTVLTLFVGRHNAIDPFGFWGMLTVPSYVVLDSKSLAMVGQPHLFPAG